MLRGDLHGFVAAVSRLGNTLVIAWAALECAYQRSFDQFKDLSHLIKLYELLEQIWTIACRFFT